MPQVTAKKQIGNRCGFHGRTRVARMGFFHRIGGEQTNGIDGFFNNGQSEF